MEKEMEGESNGVTKVAKEDASGCWKPIEDPSLSQALALMEGNSCSKGSETKEGGDDWQEGEGVVVKKQHVAMAMGMEVLDCPVCSTPLSPPIFQCALGHFVCSAHSAGRQTEQHKPTRQRRCPPLPRARRLFPASQPVLTGGPSFHGDGDGGEEQRRDQGGQGPSPLQALALMEGNSCSKGSETKEGGDVRLEGESVVVKKPHFAMAMGLEVLDCPVCSNPLSPPIFLRALGHFACSACRDKLPGTKTYKVCGVCSRDISTRCHGMECVVESIVVPCSYAVHGCGDTIAYHKKRAHEEVCPHGPCFCPEKVCGFAGTTAALLDHFAAQHEWPTTRFQYYKPFDVPVKADVHVLHGGEDGHPFLLHLASLDSTPLHVVSLVSIGQHAALESKFGCSVGFSWFKGHYQASTLDTIRSTLLSDGLPTDYFLTVPEACRGGGARVVLRVTIDTEIVYGDDDELEEDDEDDESHNEEEDEDEDSDEDEDDETSDEDDESYNKEEDEDEDSDNHEDNETSDEDDESWEEVSLNDYY